MPKAKNTDTPDPTGTEETPADLAAAPADFHAHLGPVEPVKLDAATDDPAHPLHHHGKAISGPSPEATE